MPLSQAQTKVRKISGVIELHYVVKLFTEILRIVTY